MNSIGKKEVGLVCKTGLEFLKSLEPLVDEPVKSDLRSTRRRGIGRLKERLSIDGEKKTPRRSGSWFGGARKSGSDKEDTSSGNLRKSPFNFKRKRKVSSCPGSPIKGMENECLSGTSSDVGKDMKGEQISRHSGIQRLMETQQFVELMHTITEMEESDRQDFASQLNKIYMLLLTKSPIKGMENISRHSEIQRLMETQQFVELMHTITEMEESDRQDFANQLNEIYMLLLTNKGGNIFDAFRVQFMMISAKSVRQKFLACIPPLTMAVIAVLAGDDKKNPHRNFLMSCLISGCFTQEYRKVLITRLLSLSFQCGGHRFGDLMMATWIDMYKKLLKAFGSEDFVQQLKAWEFLKQAVPALLWYKNEFPKELQEKLPKVIDTELEAELEKILKIAGGQPFEAQLKQLLDKE